MYLSSSTSHQAARRQQLASVADGLNPYFPLQTDTSTKTWAFHDPPAPPPSPRCLPQDAVEPMDMRRVVQQIEAYKSTPLRRVISTDEINENDNIEAEDYDGEEDDATMIAASNASSSRCSNTTLLDETVSSGRRFILPSRARKQQRPSTSSGRTSQSRSLNWGRQISSPLFGSSTVSPDITASSSKLSLRMSKSHSERGSFRPTRPSPQIPAAEVQSRWSESEDGNGEKKVELSKSVALATFPGRGKRFRRRLSDLFCTS